MYTMTSNSKMTVGMSLALLISVLASAPSNADVSGTWSTTGLTRIVVSSISFPDSQPERTVDIADGSYNFSAERSFTAGDVDGSWRQRNGAYTIKPNRVALEEAYRQALLTSDNPPVVNQVRLIRTQFTGSELDNGIWGTETYTYRLDLGEGLQRQLLRVVMTVRVAGKRPNPGIAAEANDIPARSLLDVAAGAALKYQQNHLKQ